MTRAANLPVPAPASRRYDSPVRDARAAETRQRILDAVVGTMAQGLTELSVPAVARAAGVSTRTVYRHFATKAALVEGLAAHLYGADDLERVPAPRSLTELEPAIRTLFRRIDAVEPAARAAMLTRAGWEARRSTIPRRLERLEAGIRGARPDLDPPTVDRIARLALILTSSFALQAWKDYLGATPDEAASEVAWALGSVIGAAESAA
jgi:AcrR family transcriptional regulator